MKDLGLSKDFPSRKFKGFKLYIKKIEENQYELFYQFEAHKNEAQLINL